MAIFAYIQHFFSTLDIAKSILAAFRHLVVMTSSLKYLEVRSTTDIFEDSIIQNKVAQLKSLVVKLESTIALLKETSTKVSVNYVIKYLF